MKEREELDDGEEEDRCDFDDARVCVGHEGERIRNDGCETQKKIWKDERF